MRTCGNLAYLCSAFASLGGVAPSFRFHLRNFVPRCCNGKTEYNDNSGCGAMEATTDYCNGGEFDGDAFMMNECKSPDGDVCDGPMCSTEAGCISMRGTPSATYGRTQFTIIEESQKYRSAEAQ